MDNRQYYTSKADILTAQIGRRRNRNRSFVLAEIVSFAAIVGFAAAFIIDSLNWLYLFPAAASLAAYLIIRHADVANSLRIEHDEALLKAYENELAYLGGHFDGFNNGEQYVDAQHQFTFDLDIFGPESLYNRICRTITTGGSRLLAAELSRQQHYDDKGTIRRISRRRLAIEALSDLTDWRTEFISLGSKGQIDTDELAKATEEAVRLPFKTFPSKRISQMAAIALLGVFYLLITLSCLSYIPASLPGTYGLMLLVGALFLFNGQIKEASRTVGRLQGQMAKCVDILKMAESLPQSTDAESGEADSELSEIRECLAGAMSAFSEISNIVNALDRRCNDLWLILSDIFFLNDFFLVHRFLRCRTMYEGQMTGWTEAINRLDMLVSMATFRYNEPDATWAEVVDSDEVVFEARGMYHPFLGKKAVRNDFCITDGHYYIITGANMAGKSTFLRSLGVNWRLAMSGLPVFADSMRVSVFSLFTSMRTTDDLARGISYFNAELLRLRQLIDECAANRNTLIILDEILKGTNSADKLNGSRLFLDYISAKRVTGVIATHDLELSKMADERPERFHNYCFEIELGASVTYSYKITPGVARNQNATYLLRQML